jgi:hypothetical protein
LVWFGACERYQMSAANILMAAAGSSAPTYVDDVFSAYTYTGNGATQTITNGIDLAGKGGMVWIKQRGTEASGATDNVIFDTARGAYTALLANGAGSGTAWGSNGGVSSFNSDGFSVKDSSPGDYCVNGNTGRYASWTFREAPKFFKKATQSHTNGVANTIDLSSLGTVGMVIVKGYNGSNGNWKVFHRSVTTGNLLYLNTTGAETADASISLSGTTLTLAASLPTDTYVIYAFAHDTSTDGLIQCGSFTTDGSGKATVNLGWEPQFILLKESGPAALITGDWYMQDVNRNWSQTEANYLRANLSGAEQVGAQPILTSPNATGFTFNQAVFSSKQFIYLAIRRPNKPPTTGAQVYNAIARTGTGAAATVTGVGFAPDLIATARRVNVPFGWGMYDRLRGANNLLDTTGASAELITTDALNAFGMDGFNAGVDGGGYVNYPAYSHAQWFFKRAPGVFDILGYFGTGLPRNQAHSLGVVPELMIFKARNSVYDWSVYHVSLGYNVWLHLNTTAAASGDTGTGLSGWPTAVSIPVHSVPTNLASADMVAYLFASKAGISKVGSYTGNGSSLTLDMGFTTGARFFMVKRTDSTGDWFVYDTTRGIIAGNDNHLSLNTTAAEVTTDDSVDPATVGLIVNQLAVTNINVNAATYIYLAIA